MAKLRKPATRRADVSPKGEQKLDVRKPRVEPRLRRINRSTKTNTPAAHSKTPDPPAGNTYPPDTAATDVATDATTNGKIAKSVNGNSMEVATVPYYVLCAPTANASRKRKRGQAVPTNVQSHSEYHRQTNEFDTRLSRDYKVLRKQSKGVHVPLWDQVKAYGSFKPRLDTLPDDVLHKGDLVFVQGNQDTGLASPEGNSLYDDCWVAQIVEIRAIDSDHVYCRVWWMYRPTEIAGGRRPHHADGEVFPSNLMDIIDATTIEGKAHMKAVGDNEDLITSYNGLLWRQSYDAVRRKTLGKPRNICICNSPANPDWGPLRCNDPALGCGKWMHWECIEKDVEDRARTQPVLDGESSQDGKANRLSIGFLVLGNGSEKSNLSPSTLRRSALTAKSPRPKTASKEPRQFKAILNRPAESTRPDEALYATAEILFPIPKSEGNDPPEPISVPVECLFCRQALLQQTGHVLLDPQLHGEIDVVTVGEDDDTIIASQGTNKEAESESPVDNQTPS